MDLVFGSMFRRVQVVGEEKVTLMSCFCKTVIKRGKNILKKY